MKTIFGNKKSREYIQNQVNIMEKTSINVENKTDDNGEMIVNSVQIPEAIKEDFSKTPITNALILDYEEQKSENAKKIDEKLEKEKEKINNTFHDEIKEQIKEHPELINKPIINTSESLNKQQETAFYFYNVEYHNKNLEKCDFVDSGFLQVIASDKKITFNDIIIELNSVKAELIKIVDNNFPGLNLDLADIKLISFGKII